MNLFFIADEHYGHSNKAGGIIAMYNRPFRDLDEMREEFIARSNAKVPDRPDSLTIHVGDMFWRKLSTEQCCEIISKLNGKHAYVRGNHEEVFGRPDSHKLRDMFEYILDVQLLSVVRPNEKKKLVWLSHYAHRVWPKSHEGSYHVYGHTHNVLPDHRRSHDVGVDANGYAPVSIDELDALMKSKGTLPPDEIEQDMLDHPWPADSGSKLGEGLPLRNFDHLPEGSQ
jgi:calcineurin-like phosphoesterase family protein